MKRFQTPGLALVAAMAAFWAYSVIDTLIRQFSGTVNYVDLVVIFVLGLISGISLGLAFALRRDRSMAS